MIFEEQTMIGNSLDQEARRQLDVRGLVVLERFMTGEFMNALRQRIAELHASEGDRAGAEFKTEPGCIRLANLVDKGTIFQELIANAAIGALVAHVLGGDFKLSSLNARTALPGSKPQPLH